LQKSKKKMLEIPKPWSTFAGRSFDHLLVAQGQKTRREAVHKKTQVKQYHRTSSKSKEIVTSRAVELKRLKEMFQR